MDELRDKIKGYILIEEMSSFHNEVRQLALLREKDEGRPYVEASKTDKHCKLDRCQPLLKGPKYERYMPLTTNQAAILEQAFNMEVHLQLPPATSCKPGINKTKHCRYHRNYAHTTKDCWALKDWIEELIQAGYLTQFAR